MFAAVRALMRRLCFGTRGCVLGPETVASRDRPALADRQRWAFDWSAEVMGRSELATVDAFARWLQEHAETDLTRRRLCALWWEFVEAHELRPVSWRQFDRGLKTAGIVRFRSSLPGRPWLYRVCEPRTATIHRFTRRAA